MERGGQCQSYTLFFFFYSSHSSIVVVVVVVLICKYFFFQMAIALHFDDSRAIPTANGVPPPLPHPFSNHGIQSSDTEDEDEDDEDEFSDDGIVNLTPHSLSRAAPYAGRHGNNEGAFSILQYILTFPFSVGYRAFNGIYFILAKIFPFLPRLIGYYPANRGATWPLQRPDPQTTTALSVTRAFEETYGNTGLKLFQGTFAKALEQAKSQIKYLLVVIQSDPQTLTGSFNRQILTDPRVVEYLNREDKIILWMGDATSSEGSRLARSFKCKSYPFTQILALYPKSPSSGTLVMKLLASIPGTTKMDPSTFMTFLSQELESHSPTRQGLLTLRTERDQERSLRNEQNAAYERSLAADREREKTAREDALRQETESKLRQVEEEKAALERDRIEQELSALKEQTAKNKAAWKVWRVLQLGSEPDVKEKPTARVTIRLLSGKRIIRRFSADQSIEDIYAFVECYDLISGTPTTTTTTTTSENEKLLEPPLNYNHVYAFSLASTLPRKILEPDVGLKVIDDKNVWPSASLVVEVDDFSEEE